MKRLETGMPYSILRVIQLDSFLGCFPWVLVKICSFLDLKNIPKCPVAFSNYRGLIECVFIQYSNSVFLFLFFWGLGMIMLRVEENISCRWDCSRLSWNKSNQTDTGKGGFSLCILSLKTTRILTFVYYEMWWLMIILNNLSCDF